MLYLSLIIQILLRILFLFVKIDFLYDSLFIKLAIFLVNLFFLYNAISYVYETCCILKKKLCGSNSTSETPELTNSNESTFSNNSLQSEITDTNLPKTYDINIIAKKIKCKYANTIPWILLCKQYYDKYEQNKNLYADVLFDLLSNDNEKAKETIINSNFNNLINDDNDSDISDTTEEDTSTNNLNNNDGSEIMDLNLPPNFIESLKAIEEIEKNNENNL